MQKHIAGRQPRTGMLKDNNMMLLCTFACRHFPKEHALGLRIIPNMALKEVTYGKTYVLSLLYNGFSQMWLVCIQGNGQDNPLG